jgi:hypothetical protein
LGQITHASQKASVAASVPQFLSAALLARLSITLGVKPPEQFMEFMILGVFAATEARATFELYLGLLGAEIVSNERRQTTAASTWRNWLSRMFKSS